MQVSSSNDRKIYNLSAGKSLPQWISDKKRRKLEQKDVDIRRRIQLMQDCEMPSVSHTTCFSLDGRFMFATGSYKPTVKCFDLEELSLKYERGLDADVVKMLMLSDDDSKFVLLEEERYLEFHTMYGRYMRLRIPHFCRDMAFCREASELYIAGCSNEVFRLNLEEGRFLEPLRSNSGLLNCCAFNDAHQLFVCGTSDGKVEAWDYRDRKRVSILDCSLNNGIALEVDADYGQTPEVTTLAFKGALDLGVGLSSGHVLLYDIRSARPRFIKDHKMGLPLKRIEFAAAADGDVVLSMDGRVLKIWYENDGRPFAAVEPGNELADFCRYPNSGLMFFANDSTKLHQYFIPSLGPAPKWCSYLESITDELEEADQPAVYDDYKFVTKLQLEEIGLAHLVGTSMLRAYMHGYFIDVRLYQQARTLTQPLAFENYKKRKLQEYIEDERKVHLFKKDGAKLPKVNKELASKLQNELSLDGRVKKKPTKRSDKATAAEAAESLLIDSRFKNLFENPDFEVDPASEQYKQMMPKLKKLQEKKERKLEASIRKAAEARFQIENRTGKSDDDSEDSGADLSQRFEEAEDGRKKRLAFNFGGLADSDDDEDLVM